MINFSAVTTLTIPEGGVVKITSDSGQVIWKKSELISGNVRLSYIEGVGSQYIDTGYVPKKNTVIKASYEYTNIPSSSVYYYVFGNYSARGRATARLMTSAYYNEVVVDMYTGADSNSFIITGAKKVGTRYDDILTNTSYTTNGTVYEITNNTAGTSNSRTLTLFANYAGGRMSYLKLYACTILEDDVAIHNFIPYLDGDGVPCLFDSVSEQFFYNGGSGSFSYSV